MLLVLDNCEHLIEAAAALAVDSLRGRRACGFWRPAASTGDGLTLEVIELGRFTRRPAVQESTDHPGLGVASRPPVSRSDLSDRVPAYRYDCIPSDRQQP
jgi:hypothetical protein